jgi:DNA-binding IclR family transcriptional regulator
MTGRKSFNRGITIMKLLADKGSMTASALARELDLNQSSVSRLLQSLIGAGFVYKPSFQQFAMDYGVLTFAGIALKHFPLASIAAKVCNRIHDRLDCGAAVAVLHEDHLLYMAFIGDNAESNLKLVDDSNFPIHESSLGLVLNYAQGQEVFLRVISQSLLKAGSIQTADELFQKVDASMQTQGIFCLSMSSKKSFNAALPFEYEGRLAALAIFSHKKTLSAERCKTILREGVEQLTTGGR